MNRKLEVKQMRSSYSKQNKSIFENLNILSYKRSYLMKTKFLSFLKGFISLI